ncbi:MAG: signal recognition particle-docking protein FtsY [Acidimicrobiales bacterium]
MLIITIVVVALALATLAATAFVVASRHRSAARGLPDARGGALPAPTSTPQAPEAASPPARAAPQTEQALSEETPSAAPADIAGSALGTTAAPALDTTAAPAEATVPVAPEKPARFRDRMVRARTLLGGYLSAVRQKGKIDEATWEDLEEALILADVGVLATARLIDDLRLRVKSGEIADPASLISALRGDLVDLLAGDRVLHMSDEGTTVWLFVGVNGVGKTTTIGKVGLREASNGHRVVMAAGDTFRAAAADQLETWAQRAGATVIRGNEGGDPGAVVFDAVQHAAAKACDLVLADTAGRLHTKTNLMEELKKVRRVAERPPGVVTETLLVIDATTGQNGLTQARQFAGAVGVTGVVLTKLDGTAKGGIVVAIAEELGIPIKLVGLGEGVADLVEFSPEEFVDALLSES